MAARKLVAIAEVFRRNPEDGFEPEPGQMPLVVHEFTRAQLAFALGESRAAADWLLTVAWHLATRLGATLDVLRDGVITRGKAELIVRLTQYLSDDEAKAVEAKILGRAGQLTPGGRRSALARAVMEVAPGKARERREAAAKTARVERWAEDSGNAALMGRELPPDEVLAADQQISWRAGELKKAGPQAAWMSCAPAPSWTWSSAKTPAPATPRPRTPPGQEWRRSAAASGCGSSRRRRGRVRRPGHADARWDRGRPSDRPGELSGLGPVDPWLARDLAAAAARNPKHDLVRDGDRPARPRRRPRLRPARTQQPQDTRRPAGRGRVLPLPRPAGTARPADTAPGGCVSRAAGRT